MDGMQPIEVSRHNLHEAVGYVLSIVTEQLSDPTLAANEMLMRDLEVAERAMNRVSQEIQGLAPHRDIRSAEFTRYMIDEEPDLCISSYLSDAIVKIEEVHKRYSTG